MPCRVETLYPLTEWEKVWLNVRMPALSNASKSFAWKLAHDLLPTEVRLKAAYKIPSFVCKYSCPSDPVGNLEHCFFECKLTLDVGSWLLNIASIYNPNFTPTSILRLDYSSYNGLLFIAIKAFQFCWTRRVAGKYATLTDFLSDIRVDLMTLEETKHRMLCEEVNKFI